MSNRSSPEAASVAPKKAVVTKNGKNGVYWSWDHDYTLDDSSISAPDTLYLYDDNTWEGHMDNCKNKNNPFTLAFYFEIATSDASIWIDLKMASRNFGEGGAADGSGDLDWALHDSQARRNIKSV